MFRSFFFHDSIWLNFAGFRQLLIHCSVDSNWALQDSSVGDAACLSHLYIHTDTYKHIHIIEYYIYQDSDIVVTTEYLHSLDLYTPVTNCSPEPSAIIGFFNAIYNHHATSLQWIGLSYVPMKPFGASSSCLVGTGLEYHFSFGRMMRTGCNINVAVKMMSGVIVHYPSIRTYGRAVLSDFVSFGNGWLSADDSGVPFRVRTRFGKSVGTKSVLLSLRFSSV